MSTSLFEFCKAQGREDLLAQWDRERNGALTPQNVSYGSKRRVWWCCERGHNWQTMVYGRTGANTGCPFCAGKRPIPGETDLASQYPELARQWHPVKNAPLTPADVTTGSHRTVWWVCDNGHEWRSEVKTRVEGCGCPVCANRCLIPGVNDLASVCPELTAEWDKEKNGDLTPADILPGSKRKVWWCCRAGHTWKAMVASRVRGVGCPYCAGKRVWDGENDLESRYSALTAQWHPTKNGTLRPRDVTAGSNRTVWWRCELGHEWRARVAARTVHGSNCPYCTGRKVLAGFNDLATLDPVLAGQWHPTLNGALTPEQVTVGSSRKAWWICPEGHTWRAVISSRGCGKKTGCPICAGRGNRIAAGQARRERAALLTVAHNVSDRPEGKL